MFLLKRRCNLLYRPLQPQYRMHSRTGRVATGRRILGSALLGLVIVLAGCSGGSLKDLGGLDLGSLSGGPLSVDDISKGLKEALTKGSGNVVGQLGRDDGFNADPAIRIPLPKTLLKARDVAAKVGLDKSFNDLEVRLNRAAELATPKAKALFLNAIRDMTLADAKGILQGPDDAATQYFRENTQVELANQMRPLVDQSLAQVGAVRTFKDVMSRYNKIPLAPKVNADLTAHVVDKGMSGIFYYLAEEEKAIRTDPLKRTSALLQRVFASQ